MAKWIIDMPENTHPKMFCEMIYKWGVESCKDCEPKYKPCPLATAALEKELEGEVMLDRGSLYGMAWHIVDNFERDKFYDQFREKRGQLIFRPTRGEKLPSIEEIAAEAYDEDRRA